MMLGIKPDYDGLIIAPCLPDDIKRASVKRVFRNVEFDITLERTGKYSLIVDGQKVDGKKVKLNGNKTINVYCQW